MRKALDEMAKADAESIARELDEARQLVTKKERDRQEEEKRHERSKALAAAHLEKTRELANEIKTGLLEAQLKLYPHCPYCGGPLGIDPHPDHIYPVVEGGLSKAENLVYVCASCNLKKGAKTLREFIERYQLNRVEIEGVLEQLSKKF